MYFLDFFTRPSLLELTRACSSSKKFLSSFLMLPSEDCVGKTRRELHRGILTSSQTMVNIHLRIDNSQVLALSIPFSDIQRLSIRPLKWLRFVTFTVCGARGNLSATPDGPAVDYDSIALGSEDYYYTPQGDAS
jgi:hypothetical protein